MTEPNQLYTGLSQAAWGYFFLTFDFNLGTVSILPRFVGFWLLFSAIGKLSGERRDLELLRPLCILLTGWSGMDWLLSWRGGDIEGRILFLDLLVTAATLYFHFQLLTDIAALAEEVQLDDSSLPADIRSHRTAYTLLITTIDLLQSVSRLFPWEWWPGVIVFAAAITCIVALMIMADLFHLRRCVHTAEPPSHL